MSQEQKVENAAAPESKAVAAPCPVEKLDAAEEALLAKFKAMFPSMIKQRVEGGWERFIVQNKFTDKNEAALRETMKGVKIAMIAFAGNPNHTVHLDHGYAMLLAEFSRRSINVPSAPALVVITKTPA